MKRGIGVVSKFNCAVVTESRVQLFRSDKPAGRRDQWSSGIDTVLFVSIVHLCPKAFSRCKIIPNHYQWNVAG